MANSEQRILDRHQAGRLLSVQANGGSVTVEIEHAEGIWITADTITEDYVGEIRGIGSAAFRLTPTGGATWAVHS